MARAIATCQHLDIYGIGGSGVMADEMAVRLYRIGINVHAWTEAHAGLASAALQRQGCVALGISNTGRTEETIEMLAQARSSGAFTVAITSAATSPLAGSADVHITAYATDAYLQPDDLAAKHAQLFILDLLYLLVAQQDFSQVATHLAASAMAVSGHRRAVHRAGAGDHGEPGRDHREPVSDHREPVSDHGEPGRDDLEPGPESHDSPNGFEESATRLDDAAVIADGPEDTEPMHREGSDA